MAALAAARGDSRSEAALGESSIFAQLFAADDGAEDGPCWVALPEADGPAASTQPRVAYLWRRGPACRRPELEVEAPAAWGPPTVQPVAPSAATGAVPSSGGVAVVTFPGRPEAVEPAPCLRLPLPLGALACEAEAARRADGEAEEDAASPAVRWRWRFDAAVAQASASAVSAAEPSALDALFAQAGDLAEALEARGYGVVDGFLRGEEADAVHLLLRKWWAGGQLEAGKLAGGQRLSQIRSDRYAFLQDLAALGDITELDTLPRALRTLQERINFLAMELSDGVASLGDFAKCRPPMFAVYPGGGSHYVKHFDYSRAEAGNTGVPRRVCTLILYLNPFWREEHGGQLRLYPEGARPVEIEPLHGRLLAFLCAERNAHEVLPAWAPRMAVSWWLCAPEE